MQISDFFINCDIKVAIQFMKEHEEYKDILPAYVAIFENCEFLDYEIPRILNDILKQYQIYFRDVFYCGLSEQDASVRLSLELKNILEIPNEDNDILVKKMQTVFEDNGYHSLFGRTQGYFGPYIWKDTVLKTYSVELPSGEAKFTVNILSGFVFRSWMDYLTFGRFGTSGWASEDGTINCIEQAYDFESERFKVSLLKHEAQHIVDMKQFPSITPTELEYRAKLVEIHYSNDLSLLQKFLQEADESRSSDSHALASSRIKKDFKDVDQTNITNVQFRALMLLNAHTKDLKDKYFK